MTSGFHTNELLKSASNYHPVAKGDLPGHSFHGNQYTQMASEISIRATKVASKPSEGYDKEGRDVAHRVLARDHERMAERLLGGDRVPKHGVASGQGEAVDKAIQAHLQAAALHHAASAVALLPRRGCIHFSKAGSL